MNTMQIVMITFLAVSLLVGQITLAFSEKNKSKSDRVKQERTSKSIHDHK